MGLELAYDRARVIIGPEWAECFDVAEEVDRLRYVWRPERVRVVLLAESHGWISGEETSHRVRHPDGRETGFARFVYCLGCGEPQLVSPAVERNTSAWQYWRLFHDTVYEPTATSHRRLTKSGKRDCQQRVQNKLDLLNNMRGAGVWLLDASVTALYGNGIKLTKRDYRAVLKACWRYHIREVLCGCEPSAVLIVGRGVHDAIGDCVCKALGVGVEVVSINQPNARIPREAIALDRRDCFDLCCRHRA